MKRIVSVAVVMMVSEIVFADAWRDPETDITWTYEISDEAATVTGLDVNSGSITIPAVLGGKPVRSIGEYAFYTDHEWNEFESVVIPEGVRDIGNYAFYFNQYLQTVSLPSTLKTIGVGAFWGCTCMETIGFPAGLEEIGSQAFVSCLALTSVVIPASVTSLGENVFQECRVKSFRVEESNPSYKSENGMLLTKDGTVLLHAVNQGTVTVPDGVTSIGAYAFANFNELEHVVMSEELTSIGMSAFMFFAPMGPDSPLNLIDFPGRPPAGLDGARIKLAVRIRYNRKYEAEWLPVLEKCQFTNVEAYDPAPKPLPPGSEGNPWVIGATEIDAVTAWTNGTGRLVLGGSGAMKAFEADGSDLPWSGLKIDSVKIGGGITAIGANAWYGLADTVSVDCESLSIAALKTVKDGFGTVLGVGDARFAGIRLDKGIATMTIALRVSPSLTDEWTEVVLKDGDVSVQDGRITVRHDTGTSKQGFYVIETK